MLVSCGVGVGVACAGEQDKSRSVKAIPDKRIFVFAKGVLICLLLADRILQNSQSLDFDGDIIAVL